MSVSDIGTWLALALMACTCAAVIGALWARSLFSMAMFLVAAGALAAASLAAFGAILAGTAQAAFGAILAPFIVLACLLLSTRASKPWRGARPWASFAGALAIAGALIAAVTPELGSSTSFGTNTTDIDSVSLLLAALFFVASAAAVALLGYGERGALQRPVERDL